MEHTLEAVMPEARAKREMKPQPFEVLNVPGAFLNVRTVEALVSFKKTKINEDVKNGKFPAPVRLSPTCSRWVSDDIRHYLACRKAGTDWTPRPDLAN